MSKELIDAAKEKFGQIMQEQLDIAADETVGTLHDKLMALGSALVLKTVDAIQDGEIETTIQPKTADLKTAYKLHKDNCKIDWTLDLDTIYNKIRGLNPFPSAWCELRNGDDQLDVKIFGIDKLQEAHDFESGHIIATKNELKVSVRGGYILLNEIQLPGKRKMDVKSLLNGYHFSQNAKML